MVLLKNFKNIFYIPELTKKLLFTLGVLIVFRIGSFIPVIGLNIDALKGFMDQQKALGGLLQYLDLLSAGQLEKGTIFALGIGPYITASIMMQLLTVAVPQLEQLSKEGDYGRKIINQYMRYLALALSIGYSFGFATFLEAKGLVLTPGIGFKFLFVLTLAVGAMFVMWLGDQISLHGIGNGSSMLIFAGIIARLPHDIILTLNAVSTGRTHVLVALLILVIFLALIGCVIMLEKGERKVPVQYARRVVGQRVYGGQSSYIPFKINNAGVMPAIFASSVLRIPIFALTMLAARWALFEPFTKWLQLGGFMYSAFEFGLIIFFTFFYTALFFNPTELADNMKKSGGFIPGLRPGKQTSDYFDYLLSRIGLVGALYLAGLALIPNLMYNFLSMPFYFGGTSLLIMVGVALETSAQIESYVIEQSYGSFLSSGRLKSRTAR